MEKMIVTETLQHKVMCRRIDQDIDTETYNKIKLNTLALAFRQIEMANCPKPVPGETSHGFVPLPCRTYIDILIEGFVALGKASGKKFLDVGCGIGTKILLANAFFEAHGIDIDERNLALAHLLGAGTASKGDCLTYEGYGDFDFLYFFRPIIDAEKEVEFEHRIHDQMKPGAVIAPIYTELDWGEFDDLTKIGWLYQKP